MIILSTTSSSNDSAASARHMRVHICNFKASKSEIIGIFAIEAVIEVSNMRAMSAKERLGGEGRW